MGLKLRSLTRTKERSLPGIADHADHPAEVRIQGTPLIDFALVRNGPMDCGPVADQTTPIADQTPVFDLSSAIIPFPKRPPSPATPPTYGYTVGMRVVELAGRTTADEQRDPVKLVTGIGWTGWIPVEALNPENRP